MSIYDINYSLAWSNLISTTKRKPRMLAWGTALLKPMQWLRDLIFYEYADGSTAANWAFFVYYLKGNRVIFSNKKVYEALVDTPFSGFPSPSDPNYWIEVSPNFIGLRERVMYNSQIILFEYSLNKWFQVLITSPQIYIGDNNVASGFILGGSSATSSVMANNSAFSTSFMGNSYTAVIYDFTVFVPSVLFATLGSTVVNRENNIRTFVDKYKLAGLKYNVVTF